MNLKARNAIRKLVLVVVVSLLAAPLPQLSCCADTKTRIMTKKSQPN